jgi:hypothetical protein
LLTDGTFTLVNDWRICVRCSLVMLTFAELLALLLLLLAAPEVELAPPPPLWATAATLKDRAAAATVVNNAYRMISSKHQARVLAW